MDGFGLSFTCGQNIPPLPAYVAMAAITADVSSCHSQEPWVHLDQLTGLILFVRDHPKHTSTKIKGPN